MDTQDNKTIRTHNVTILYVDFINKILLRTASLVYENDQLTSYDTEEVNLPINSKKSITNEINDEIVHSI